MKSLTRIDDFDFDDAALASSYGIYGMHPERALTDEPRHHYLSHWLHPFTLAKEAHILRRPVRALLLFCISMSFHMEIR
jgi:hypothetical protein